MPRLIKVHSWRRQSNAVIELGIVAVRGGDVNGRCRETGHIRILPALSRFLTPCQPLLATGQGNSCSSLELTYVGALFGDGVGKAEQSPFRVANTKNGEEMGVLI